MTLDERITRQLGRRKEMLDSITAWEKPRPKILAKYAVGLSVAACLAVVLFVYPFWKNDSISPIDALNIDTPSLVDYRAASAINSSIDEAVCRKDYKAALPLIGSAIETVQESLRQIEDPMDETDESLLYEIDFEKEQYLRLTWLQIYCLIRLEQFDRAIPILNSYISLNPDNLQEATSLLELIQHNEED